MAALTQINRAVRGLPITAPPAFTGVPYAVPDVQVGDTSKGVIPSTTGFPIPTVSASIVMSDSTVHAHPYTFVSGDVGKSGTFTVSASNGVTITATATPFTVQAPITAAGQNLLGTNTTSVADYSAARYLNNAGQQGRGFWTTGSSSNSPVYITSLDAHGWPTVAYQYLLSGAISGNDGNLVRGTRQCIFTVDPSNPNRATTVTGSAGATCSGISTSDGVTYNFTLVTGAGNPTLFFDGGTTFVGIPVNPGDPTPTAAGPEFYAPMVASLAQQSSIRTMDLANVLHNTDVNWSDRIPDKGTTMPLFPCAWERIIRLLNAVFALPGSKLKHVIFNIPGRSTPAYATALATLVSSLIAPGLTLTIEKGNEWWNFAGPAPNGSVSWFNPTIDNQDFYSYAFSSSLNEGQSVAGFLVGGSSNYGYTDGQIAGMTINNLVSVVRASNVVTVTTTNAVKSFVTVGSHPIVNHQTLPGTWSAGYTSNGTTYSPITIATVGTNSFTYNQTGPDGAVATTDKIAFFFNPTSTLLADNLSYNLNDLILKWYVRASYQDRNAWHAVRPQDGWLLNMQQYGPSNGFYSFTGCMTTDPLPIRYGNWLSSQNGGTSVSDWVTTLATAPYTHAYTQYDTVTAGSNVVTGVPFASEMQAGDVVALSLSALAGATLTGAFNGTALTITGFSGSRVFAGQSVTPDGGSHSYQITALGTSTGGNGTATVSSSSVILIGVSCTSSAGATFTANVTAAGVLSGVSGLTGTALAVGQTITATGIPGGTTIASINSTNYTLSAAPVISGVSLTVTGTTAWTAVVSGTGKVLTVADNMTASGVGGRLSYVAGSPAGICAAWKGCSATYGASAMHAHAYLTTKYGLKAMAYEGGNETPTADMTLTDAQVTALVAHPGIGVNLTSDLDNWFGIGLDNFHVFSNIPGWQNDPYAFKQSGWSDSASPKVAALLGYTGTRAYSNMNSDGAGGVKCLAKYAIATTAALSNANGTNYGPSSESGGILNWTTNSVERDADWPIVIPRAGKYSVILNACDSAVGTVAHIRIDDFTTDVGTVTVLGTGAGDASNSSPADSAPLLVTFTKRGRHNLRVMFPATGTIDPAGTGIRPGVVNVRVVPLGS